MQPWSDALSPLRRALARGGTRPASTAVTRRLEDGSPYAAPGTVEFSEATVNEATGTVTLRARFPNPGGLLLPGMFVTALFEQAVEPDAFLLPQQAVQRVFDGSAFVYLVGQADKFARSHVVPPHHGWATCRDRLFQSL